MEISVREAATLLGCSSRTVRAQLARGELPGRKRQGRWRVDRRSLPLTEAQHQALQRKAETVRQAVEQALPSRLAGDRSDRARSVLDLDAFRVGAMVLLELRREGPELSQPERERIAICLESSLIELSDAALGRGRRTGITGTRRTGGTTRVSASRCLVPNPRPSSWECRRVGSWMRLRADPSPAAGALAPARSAVRSGRFG